MKNIYPLLILPGSEIPMYGKCALTSFSSLFLTIQCDSINRDLFEWGVGSWECGVVVEILRISNKIESHRDLHRHSQLPTPNSKLLDKFQFIEVN